MSNLVPERDAVEFAAAEWIVRLKESNVSVEEVAEWQQWMGTDERHAQAFKRLEALWDQFDALPLPPPASSRALAGDDYRGEIAVGDYLKAPRPSPMARGFKSSWALSAAACLALIVAAFAGMTFYTKPQPELAHQMIETAVGENRSISLADGSTVKLGGHSRLSFSLQPKLRDIVLEEGEAFFAVAKDPSRPFQVHAGNATVTAVGTEFDVHRSDDKVTVSVIEGKVMVQPMAPLVPVPWLAAVKPVGEAAPLVAGERTTVNRNGVESTPAVINAQATLDWQDGRLAFEGESLRYVVQDVNRYTGKPIVIADEGTAALKVTGTIMSNNVMGWVLSLKSAFGISAEVRADRIILRKE
ncbi:MAG TPA: FecR domain-containing protein [Steroidobacteraceae bacterium]|jgi:transmembrane sensor